MTTKGLRSLNAADRLHLDANKEENQAIGCFAALYTPLQEFVRAHMLTFAKLYTLMNQL